MSSETHAGSPGGHRDVAEPKAAAAQLAVPLVLAGLYWAFYFTLPMIDLSSLARFLSRLAAAGLFLLAWMVWWWARRRSAPREKLLGFAFMAGGMLLGGWLCHPSLGIFGIVLWGLPRLFTAVTLWMLVARRGPPALQRAGLAIVVTLTCGYLTLLRFEGLSGEQESAIAWRWSPSAEQQFLASQAGKTPASLAAAEGSLTARPGDWPGFRGPDRDGVIRGTRIDADWQRHPPRRLWQNRVGPAWSSLIVVGNRLFTQEQRGPQEAVLCYDAATGDELWAHSDDVRFEESVSGAGPRATPTFADGRLYTLGGTGLLNCLDAATGRSRWQRDIAADAGAAVPMWGFASSPLVVEGIVVVYASGSGDKRLLGYRAETGAPAWTAAAGEASYSSPQLARLSGAAAIPAGPAPVAGQAQVLFLSNQGLAALDPASGKLLWEHLAAAAAAPRALQPHVLGPSAVLLASDSDLGMVLLDVMREDENWSSSVRWSNAAVRTSFNDLVVDGDYAYGFDGVTLYCVDLHSGQQQWREGRYGHGQVVLLADQHLLLVLSEKGQAVLVRAEPQAHEEVAHFPVLAGKCWSHPVVARGRLYARNAEEMACYDLTAAQKESPKADRQRD